MVEIWKSVAGYETRYEISNFGNLKALSFMQRYILRNGKEAFRKTKERSTSQQLINSGYLIAHLHLDNVRKAVLVHRLVAVAFCSGKEREVNHLNGIKTDNSSLNLEWVSSKDNHDHAVDIGLNTLAIPVLGPNGKLFPSIARAAKIYGKAARRFRRVL